MTENTAAQAPEWFVSWFTSKFGKPVPESFAQYLAEHPNGLWSNAGTLWKADTIIDATEERDLHEKGVCFIGETAFETVFLLRARDGRVFASDRFDASIVDAWFSDIDSCISLLDFEDMPTAPG
ncbi:MAG: hypothetical protein V4793_22795 [Paraburkholderia tropica]|uniref:SMI1/KNR4 family protein n=1 Tax=Paraburkholderia tropica TaxID=92647 RepID=A0ABX5MEX5_9BURK|nr:hypothetical protein [Paraburkholderia tropica]MBB2984233.1 hypothetical protein [Paraburkholderia tropica]MBB3004977.1 hypothetical protein [Paraburkholderia tropica]MBB6323265.1 hypothetical protein [Paraburkholderia tropica]PXX05063.1 hypothetical protein C7400_14429 [Paraburkholderia tropica]PZW70491.1 hypothetical protein C7399_14429 [Paraburkholderia tropica]